MAGTFHVGGKFLKVVADGSDSGTDLDLIGLEGLTVVFKSNIPSDRATLDSANSALVYMSTRTVVVQSDGTFKELLFDAPAAGLAAKTHLASTPGIDLPAADDAYGSPVQWTVAPVNSVFINGQWVRPQAFTFNAPDDGWSGTLDELAPVAVLRNVQIGQGPRGYTPWFVKVSDGPPALYQAYDPEGPVGPAQPLEMDALQSSTMLRPDDGGAVALCQHPPTITHSASATSGLKAFGHQTVGVNYTGVATNLITAYSYAYNDVSGIDENIYGWEWETYHLGATLEIYWRAALTNDCWMQVFIDDQPTTPAPFQPSGITLTALTNYYTKLSFATAGPRKVRIRWENMGLIEIRTDQTGAVLATKPMRPVIACVGTSNTGYDSASPALYHSLGAWPWMLADALGMSCAQFGGNGSGYVNAPAFGGTGGGDSGGNGRLNALIRVNPDFIIVEGANNDNASSYATINAAAAAYYDALNTSLPGVPVLVVGPMATDAATDTSSNRSRNSAAVRDAALAAPNVVAYIDPGDMADPGGAVWPTYATATAYTAGQRVIYQGGVYKALSSFTSAGATPDPTKWVLTSWHTGTGSADYPAGSGTRDVLFNATHGHATAAGQRNYAYNIAREVLRHLVKPAERSVRPTFEDATLKGATKIESGATLVDTILTGNTQVGSGLNPPLTTWTPHITGAAILGSTGRNFYDVTLGAGAAPQMPTAVSNSALYRITNLHSAALPITTTGGETIEGLASYPLPPGGCVWLLPDGANWRVVGVNGRALHPPAVTLTAAATLPAVPGVEHVYYFGAGAVPVMPTAVGNTSVYPLKNVHTANITLATTGGQTIDGSTTVVMTPNTALELRPDGTNWRIH